MGLQVDGGGVSGNSPGELTPFFQFDNICAMVALSRGTGRRESTTEEQWIPPELLYRVSLSLTFTPKTQCPPVFPGVPCTSELVLVLRVSRSNTAKVHWQTWPHIEVFAVAGCCCYGLCSSLPLGTMQLHGLASSYLLPLQG